MMHGRVRAPRLGVDSVSTLHEMFERRRHIHAPKSLLDHASDILATFAGSWPFLALHASWFTLWVVLRIERFPFGLLTMLVSLEAIFLSTIILMSGNRQSSKDRLRDDTEAGEIAVLYRVVNEQQTIQHELLDLQHQQMQILAEQNAILAVFDEQAKRGMDEHRGP